VHVIRVVLADDQTLVRKGIRSLLDLTSDIRVVDEAASGEQAVAKVAEHEPDVALFDVRMPGCDGVEALRRCKAAGYAPPTILLTTFDDDAVLRDGIAAGIAGFLLKDVDLEELADAVRAVATGRTLIGVTASRAREAVRQQGLAFDALDDVASVLTPREVEILRLVAAGMSNREIGEALGLAEGTVKNHASNILSKLGVRDRTRAVLKALERGIL
jgi:DNA-binding NarL/FixJ family response regulator